MDGGVGWVEEEMAVVVVHGRRGEGREDRAEEAAERRVRRWARTDGGMRGGGTGSIDGLRRTRVCRVEERRRATTSGVQK